MKQQVTSQIILFAQVILSMAQLTSSADLTNMAARRKVPTVGNQDLDLKLHTLNQHELPSSRHFRSSSNRDAADHAPHSTADSSPEPDSNSDQTDGSEASGPYLPPEELEIIRLNDTSVVLRWDINVVAMDHLQFFKTQYKSTKKNAQWKTDSREIPPTSRADQINGLKPGNYYFIVSAVYDNDDNIPSQQKKYTLRARSKISESEMPEKTAPIIRWNETASDYVRFKWKYPVKERDMPYFGYLVYYRSAHSVSDYTIYNTLDENVELAELEPDTPYEAKVVAYNLVGISDFSDTIIIKTKPKQNNTASSSTTTLAPIVTTLEEDQSTTTTPSYEQSSSTTPELVETTTRKPREEVTIYTTDTTITSTYNKTFPITFSAGLSNLFSQLMTRQDDTTLAIKYSLFFLLPMIVITSILICLISCHRKRKSPLATDDSAQSDLDSYFKNSFPGVEKDLHMMVSLDDGHQGFINNHPHIHDYT